MKDATLRVGVGSGLDASFVKLPLMIPNTRDEWTESYRGSDAVANRMNERAYRIERQENSGAREYIAANPRKSGETQEEYQDRVSPGCQALVDAYDPTVEKPRGGTRGPKQVKLPKGKLTAEAMQAALKEQGVSVTFE